MFPACFQEQRTGHPTCFIYFRNVINLITFRRKSLSKSFNFNNSCDICEKVERNRKEREENKKIREWE